MALWFAADLEVAALGRSRALVHLRRESRIVRTEMAVTRAAACCRVAASREEHLVRIVLESGCLPRQAEREFDQAVGLGLLVEISTLRTGAGVGSQEETTLSRLLGRPWHELPDDVFRECPATLLHSLGPDSRVTGIDCSAAWEALRLSGLQALRPGLSLDPQIQRAAALAPDGAAGDWLALLWPQALLLTTEPDLSADGPAALLLRSLLPARATGNFSARAAMLVELQSGLRGAAPERLRQECLRQWLLARPPAQRDIGMPEFTDKELDTARGAILGAIDGLRDQLPGS